MAQMSRAWILSGLVCLVALTGLAGVPELAFAQNAQNDSALPPDAYGGVIYKKKTVVSFDDDTIDGDLTRPDHGYIESRKRVRHSNLIKIRNNFREKILNSFVDI